MKNAMDHTDACIPDSWCESVSSRRSERKHEEDAARYEGIDKKLLPYLPDNRQILEWMKKRESAGGGNRFLSDELLLLPGLSKHRCYIL